jgi:hypothetical protein
MDWFRTEFKVRYFVLVVDDSIEMHRCRLPNELFNDSQYALSEVEMKKWYTQGVADGGSKVHCFYCPNATNDKCTENEAIACDHGFTYDRSEFTESLITKVTIGRPSRWPSGGTRVQNVPRSAWVKTHATSVCVSTDAAFAVLLAASVFTHVLRGTFCTPCTPPRGPPLRPS